jgi:hypothetical protein
MKSSGSLPLEGRAGEGVEAGTRFRHPSLTLPLKGRGPEETARVPGPGWPFYLGAYSRSQSSRLICLMCGARKSAALAGSSEASQGRRIMPLRAFMR